MTKNKGIAAIIWVIITAVVFSVGYFTVRKFGFIQYNTPSDILPPLVRDSSVSTDWITYRSKKYGFEFKYPPESEATLTGLYNEPDNAIWQLPKQNDTNLIEKTLKTDLKSDGQSCGNPTVGQRSSVVINDISFTLEHSSDSAMSQRYEEYRYITYRNNTCIALAFALHSGNYVAVYKGTDRIPPPTFDSDKEKKVFEQILATFRFTK